MQFVLLELSIQRGLGRCLFEETLAIREKAVYIYEAFWILSGLVL